MKQLIKEILYAAHECGICGDWSDKAAEDVLDILNRDGVLTIDEEELDRMANKEFPTSVFYNCYGECVGEDNKRKEKAAFKLGYRKAKGE